MKHKIEWKARKKRKFNLGIKSNLSNSTKIDINETSNTNNSDITGIYPSFADTKTKLHKSNFDSLSDSSEKSNDASHKEAPRRPKKKITQQTVAKRITINPNFTLLSTFMDESVPPLPIIVLSDQEDIDTYKIQMERIKTRNLFQ